MSATYTKVFADPYPGGWKAKPDLSTPYTTSIRDNHDATLRALENHLYSNPIPQEIEDLSDVDFTTSPTDGQILIWDATAGKFKPGNHTDLSQASIGDLSDVVINNADKIDGNVLTYEASSGMLKLKAGGGGGTSYSTSETIVGTDEDGNTIYAKTRVDTLNPTDQISGGSFQIISTAHRVLKYEAHVWFEYSDSMSTNRVKMFALPFLDGYSSGTYYNLWSAGNIYVEYLNSSSSVPYIYWDTCYKYGGQQIYPSKSRITVYYIKTT